MQEHKQDYISGTINKNSMGACTKTHDISQFITVSCDNESASIEDFINYGVELFGTVAKPELMRIAGRKLPIS